ncbi:MAG: MFS transporter [bacterium]|nr:MFS transporter [bacterium]MDE0289169.1 MFS transporter [bacterium]MDE0377210.1 MFS transporter [bacterium]
MTGLRNRVSSLGSSESVVLCILCLGVFSTALDQTVVVAALPGVMLDLEIPLTELDRASWIVTAYLVAYTVAMPLGGRLSDVHGRVRMFQAALVVFSVGSAFVALAPNFGWIVSARVVQAIGGGATVPIGLAMAVAAVSARRRGIAIGLVAAAAEAGSVLGPLYGGAIIELLGWRWIFWLDIPQSFILIALLALLPDRANPEAKMDYLGAIVMGGALIFLTAGLSQRSLFSATSVYPYLLVATGALLVGVLVRLERRTTQPLLAPFLYRSRAFLSSNGTQVLVGVALIIALVSVPLMAGTVQEKSALDSVLQLLRLTAAIPVGAVVGGYVLRWAGVRSVCITGLVLMGTGLVFMSTWETQVAEPRLTLPLISAGLGFGLVIPPIGVSALSASPSSYWGAAASLVTAARMVGMALGLAALSAWGIERFYSLTADVGLGPSFEETEAVLIGAGVTVFQNLFMITGLLSLLAIVPALLMREEEMEEGSYIDEVGR